MISLYLFHYKSPLHTLLELWSAIHLCHFHIEEENNGRNWHFNFYLSGLKYLNEHLLYQGRGNLIDIFTLDYSKEQWITRSR